MKQFLLLAVLAISGCSVANKVHPNLATRLLPDYPALQAICDHAGGCQNVEIYCTRYDGTGNSTLRNTTFWKISTTNDHITGFGWTPNDHLDTKHAIAQAIGDYLDTVRSDERYSAEPPTVYPNETSCNSDCGK